MYVEAELENLEKLLTDCEWADEKASAHDLLQEICRRAAEFGVNPEDVEKFYECVWLERVDDFGELLALCSKSSGQKLRRIARNQTDMTKKPACRIYVIKAAASPVAAVFRRGPSKQVQILKWDMNTDVFTPGQWFKGRIYERRCDVSPNGQYLIYFATKHKPPLYSWTAVSKLPYLTALALWPTRGPLGGGGLFETEQCIQLDHTWFAMAVAEGFELPASLKINQLGEGPGSGEDEPIHRSRMQRDGWRVKQEAVANYSGLSKSELIDHMQDFLAIAQKLQEDMSIELPALLQKTTPYADTGPMFAVYDPPEILEKQSGTSILEMTTLVMAKRTAKLT